MTEIKTPEIEKEVLKDRPKVKIEYMKINDLVPYDKNPRKNARAVDVVADSIKAFGFQNPIIIDKNNEIIAGHTRYGAAKQLDMKEVPIIRAEGLTKAQVKAFRIMDNKSQEFAAWNFDLLKDEFYDLEKLEANLETTGFTLTEITKIWDNKPGDYSEKNKEIELEDLEQQLNHTCPKCGFQFNDEV